MPCTKLKVRCMAVDYLVYAIMTDHAHDFLLLNNPQLGQNLTQ